MEGLEDLLQNLNVQMTLHDSDGVDSIVVDPKTLKTPPESKKFGAVLAKRFVFFGGLARVLTLLLARFEKLKQWLKVLLSAYPVI